MKTWTKNKEIERMPLLELAYDAASEEWREAVYVFAVTVYLPERSEPFIFQDLTHAYADWAKRNNKPITGEKRAFAGLQQRLLKQGKMERVAGEYGRSYEGSLRPKYRSLERTNHGY